MNNNAPNLSISKTRFFAGVWEGILRTNRDEYPAIEVQHLGSPVLFELTQRENKTDEWSLRVPVPVKLLSDGVQVFLITEKGSTNKLASFTIITGEPLEDDIRAETELLRAELDMLKRAFRRHCLESHSANAS